MNEDRIADVLVISVIIAVIWLKITNVITIPWLWLLSPIWIPFGVGCIFAFVFLIVALIEIYIDKKENKK